MAAKLREKDGFYWVVVHHQGRRKWKKIGKDKRTAQRVVHEINARLALGKFSMEVEEHVSAVEDVLRRWYADYKPTFSPSFADNADRMIRHHLIPFFGPLKITELEERHLLQFIREKTAEGAQPRPLKASTLLNILSVLRRVLALAVDEGPARPEPVPQPREAAGEGEAPAGGRGHPRGRVEPGGGRHPARGRPLR